MKKKDLKTLAKKIAAVEQKYQLVTDKEEKATLEQELMHLTSQIHSLEDMELVDEMVQDLLG